MVGFITAGTPVADAMDINGPGTCTLVASDGQTETLAFNNLLHDMQRGLADEELTVKAEGPAGEEPSLHGNFNACTAGVTQVAGLDTTGPDMQPVQPELQNTANTLG